MTQSSTKIRGRAIKNGHLEEYVLMAEFIYNENAKSGAVDTQLVSRQLTTGKTPLKFSSSLKTALQPMKKRRNGLTGF
jgi:hypothetical protein